jgi:hypothetical protein
MGRAHFAQSLRHRRDQTITVLDTPRIRLQTHVVRELVQTQSTSAREPLTVASDRNDERSVSGIE